MSDIDNENTGSGDNTGTGEIGNTGSASHVSAKVRMGALQTTIRNVRQKPSSIFSRATGMSMQTFATVKAEEGKAYDSYGKEIENWSSYWTYTSSTNNIKSKSTSIKELPTNIPVIVNQKVVTGANNMFYGCQSLINLDLSNWDSSNITSMESMFAYLKATTIDISSLDTSKVTNMQSMFASCSLTNLDLSNFNTSNVTNMYRMFQGCSATSINVTNWDTSNVTTMYDMFNSCKIKTLDLTSWDTSKVTTMYNMFRYCTNLTTIYVSEKWDTTNANTSGMFASCGTSKVTIKQ